MKQATELPLPAPSRPEPLKWVRENLFNGVWNSLLTIITLVLLFFFLKGALSWAFTQARWDVIPANFRLLMVGPYPQESLWRVWAGVMLLNLLAGMHLGNSNRTRIPAELRNTWLTFLVIIAAYSALQFSAPSAKFLPAVFAVLTVAFFVGRAIKSISTLGWTITWVVGFVAFLFLIGGNLGGGAVTTDLWGGLLLTFLLAVVAIVASFPLGILLAIGRKSSLPIVSGFCVVFIEVVRGVPLIAVLFMAQLFLPLFLPDVRIDKVLRAMVALTIFSAAYLAEYLRGGLQAVPKGQDEAARAMGLTGTQTMILIVLPQALRAVVPAIVGQFISLFKDTSLVAIIGLTDLLGVANSITANSNYIGLSKEVYIGITLIYLFFTIPMARASRAVEARLNESKR
ncbi:amino acid ABC transporter permease [Deinococcus cellulosilyticus]|uniref:Polar amino acid ABC transporter permease n=1 Tax=Deinococcus cellulosilyticus (strain DSM 18568 / NBRC 106333 / KACC 11606 / 5516J-15) TaxID=1223518 RepID=A0A511N0T7_DEIC1|nr:amino acid ABC transporter permease [Deinococcus cellulosilyticus]GEM45996.1 polar amino acid ABC transporter permease [Deinococcus cellulosilyticus NBRC 106333 = KACC 11606]